MKKIFLILSLIVFFATTVVLQCFADNIDENQIIKNQALIKAVSGGNLNRVKSAIRTGADINFKDDNGYFPLLSAVMKNNYEITKFLIDSGANLNITSGKHSGKSGVYDYGTALIFAVKDENYEIIKLLIDSGADLNIQNEDGKTALMMVAESGNEKITKLLIDKGADINIESLDKMTALSYAARYGKNKTAKQLIAKGADVNHVHYYDKTPLIEAADNGYYETVKLLVKSGAGVNHKNKNGKTALDIAKNNKELAVKNGKTTENFDKTIKFLEKYKK